MATHLSRDGPRLALRWRMWRRRLGRRLAHPGQSPGLEIGVAVVALLLGIASYAFLTGQRAPAEGFSPEAATLLLVANLLPLLLLLLLIARRVAVLIANRRAGRAGARLHVRLVALFAGLAAAPTILVVIFASLLFQFGVQFWFSDRARTVLDNADRVAEAYVDENRSRIIDDILAMGRDIANYGEDFGLGSEAFRDGLAFQLAARNLTEAAVFRVANGRPVMVAASGLDDKPLAARLADADLATVRPGQAIVLPSTADRVQAVVRLPAGEPLFLYASRRVEPRVLEQVARTRSALSDYRELTDRSRSLQWRFNIILLVVSLLIVAVAVWFAILLATRLVRPIADLAEAAERVGGGDFDVRVPAPRDADEVGALTRAFNRMTGQLKAQQAALMSASRQAEERRRFTEAVLAGVSAGVLSIDPAGIVRLANASAEALLEAGPQGLTGRRLDELLPTLAELLDHARIEGVAAAELQRQRQGREGAMQTLAVRLTADPGGAGSIIITFDDITRQIADQRHAAWSDVARRIAHEIRNPLTPIILSAERLKRRFAPSGSDAAIFHELTDTIVRQVGDLRRMVDEFSAFARMPAPVFAAEDLADIARQAVFLAEVANPDITFTLAAEPRPEPLVCDRRQMAQMFTNLIKNATEAIAAGSADGGGEVRVSLRDEGGLLSVEIADNGVGLPAALRDRLTEPYVTTRARGTGLGLAIVRRIVEDHGGRLLLENREPGPGAVARVLFDRAAHPAPAAPPPAERVSA